jgi:two-component system, NtrC family, response regulator AtoC
MTSPDAKSGSLMIDFGGLPPLPIIFGFSSDMQAMRQRIEKISAANVPLLIQGESGTGKNLLAELVHKLSPWGKGPFVKVNCAAIPGTLLESELFGYERGAFTGAVDTKPGRVEMARSGTLFMDEISEIELNIQSKLLHVLQDGQYSRIGGQEDRKLEARVICSTNRVPEDEIKAGRFRQDLFYRVSVMSIQVPPLRQRATDIGVLADYFLAVYNEKYGRQTKPLSVETMERMHRYHWPGNIRELENLIRRYVIVGTEDVISTELRENRQMVNSIDIPLGGSIRLKDVTRKAVRELERKIILRMLDSNQWNRRHVARALNISYRALLYKIREAGLPSRGGRTNRPDLSADTD